MAFLNPAEVVEYRDPSWDPNSVWRFARYRTQADQDLITQKVAKTEITYDAKEARKRGRNYSPKFSQETLMSGLMALLTVMSRGWEGIDFVIPDWATTSNGAPHPMRGRVAPCTAEWIEKLDTRALARVEQFLQDLYEPEDEEEQEYFRQPDSGVVRSEAAGVSAGEVPVGPAV